MTHGATQEEVDILEKTIAEQDAQILTMRRLLRAVLSATSDEEITKADADIRKFLNPCTSS